MCRICWKILKGMKGRKSISKGLNKPLLMSIRRWRAYLQLLRLMPTFIFSTGKICLGHISLWSYITVVFILSFWSQVAAQQGSYLSRCFNRRDHCTEIPEGPRQFKGSGRHQFRPFQYVFCFDSHHFVYVKSNMAKQQILWLLRWQGTSISGNSLLSGESKLQPNCQGTGFPWVTALSGSGILYMRGNNRLLNWLKIAVLFLILL